MIPSSCYPLYPEHDRPFLIQTIGGLPNLHHVLGRDLLKILAGNAKRIRN
ncbi:hypothetical protein ABI_23030 [Asticcacaulis biprosthecium C19]|uniref:Uncharacterized protein n=1 Tax=Asticcacaulis biprosthecium C19 TaxID=715226 RepID=F4QNI3_9CAUL|nr:hypothetical protein ABI_23030 [Asticcacaulis biprosthecium C19]